MNKSRRTIALQARAFARAGIATLVLDLRGCGESAGEFGAARWDDWKRDVERGLEWLGAEHRVPAGLWGLRLGALLAAEVASERREETGPLVLWAPVADGATYLNQFLRLKVAGAVLSDASAPTSTKALRASLAAGEPLEIGGYELGPALAEAIDARKLAALAPERGDVHWFDVTAVAGGALAPASQRIVDAWRMRGARVEARAVEGAPFWATLEIAECTPLVAATTAAIVRAEVRC